ncbi:MAG: hypothetical protein ACI4A5_01210, partial [Hominilimicola sp.]
RYTGEEYGEYLGGYNSGTGSGCFQNSSDTTGLSFYFGGDKSGTSTIGKDYVYAENGTNRIFVRSTRKAGTFTLYASMDGIPESSVTPAVITSTAVEMDGGLTTQLQSVLSPDAKEAPATSDVPAMKPLMFTKKLISWADVKKVTEEDTTVYYDVYLNGEKLNLSEKTFVGIQDTLFGPIYEILLAAQNAGASGFTMTYDDSASPVTLEVASGGHTYQYQENRNQILIDNTELTECVDTVRMKNGVMIANLPLMLANAGVRFGEDKENHILNITVEKGAE